MEAPLSLPVPTRRWTDDQWAVIRAGHRAADMDSKWNAFVEDDRRFLHRSWTGHGIYEAQFARDVTGWHIVELLVCGNPQRYRRRGDDFDVIQIEALIDGVMLGEWDGPANQRWTEALRS